MAFEKIWSAIPTQLLLSNGGKYGEISVPSTDGFKTKQKVRLFSNLHQGSATFEVKQVVDQTNLILGPISVSLVDLADLTGYLTIANAAIDSEDQPRQSITPDKYQRSVFEEAPTVAIRSHLVDKLGAGFDSVKDSSGKNRLAVDGQFHAEVDVQVDVDVDGYYDSENNPDPDNVGLVGHTRSEDTDQTHQVQRVTAKRGTTNTDTVSQDVSLHDANGNAFDPTNPIPVETTYEKFFPMINASSWMKLANYDEIVPLFAGNTMTLTYKENGSILGTAVVTNYNALNGWSLKLNKYIAEDDGTALEDDDGTLLNLD